jgi:DNA-binding HxlR family transcriptional regulator
VRHDELFETNCAISRTAGILGERWVISILRAAFFRARTFEEYQRATGVARNILTDRLNRLVEVGVLERRVYEQHANRTLHEYRLTEAGIDLYPVIATLMTWGNKHGGFVHGPPVELVHDTCGHVADPVLTCSHCHEPLDPRQVTPRPGPGAGHTPPPLGAAAP